MDIAYFSKFYSYPSRIAGSINYTRAICRELSKKVNITLVTQKFDTQKETQKEKFQVKFTQGKTLRIGYKNVVLPPFPLLAAKIAKKIQAEVLHFTTPLYKAPLLYSYYSIFKLFSPKLPRLFQPLVYREYTGFERALLNSLEKNTIVSSKNMALIHSMKYVPEGVDLNRIQKIKAGKKRSEFTVIFFGQLEQRKNPLLLAEAAALLKKENIVFLWSGTGSQKNALQNFIKDQGIKGELLPFRKDILRIVKSADIAVFPFAKNIPILASPQSLLEAMALGTNVIVSNYAPMNEICNSRNAEMLNELTAEKLAEKILTIYNNHSLAKEKRKQALQDVKEFDIKKTAKMLLAEYEAIA